MLAFESLFNLTGNTFTGNSASHGVVLYILSSRSSFCIANSTFSNNHAVSWSGVLYAYDSSINITNSYFMNNGAHNGGVLYASDSSLTITSSSFINNRAGHGGILLTSYSSFSITTSDFTYNSAGHGGVMYADLSSLITIIGDTYVNNLANYGGGVVYCLLPRLVFPTVPFWRTVQQMVVY